MYGNGVAFQKVVFYAAAVTSVVRKDVGSFITQECMHMTVASDVMVFVL